MNFSFAPRGSHLKVFSAVCSNLAVVFFTANLATHDILTLTFNIVAAILFLYLGVQAEELIKEYD